MASPRPLLKLLYSLLQIDNVVNANFHFVRASDPLFLIFVEVLHVIIADLATLRVEQI
jgi:hypothetical protein